MKGTGICELSFRQLRESHEVLEQLALRCRMYAATPHLGALLDHDCLGAGLEVDAFDRHSDLYGLFACMSEGERLVGSLRVTGPSETTYASMVDGALESHPALFQRARGRRRGLLPCLNYLPGEQLGSEVSRWATTGKRVFEGGRLALDAHVLEPRCAARAARFLARCACALPLVEAYEVVFVTCLETHSAFYTRHGFCAIEGLRGVEVPSIGIRFTAHLLLRDRIDDGALRVLAPLAAEYDRTGEVRIQVADSNEWRTPCAA